MKHPKDDGASLWIDTAVIAGVLLVPIAIALMFWFNSAWWLLLAVPSLLIVMAG